MLIFASRLLTLASEWTTLDRDRFQGNREYDLRAGEKRVKVVRNMVDRF
jgi:hypothetical protein